MRIKIIGSILLLLFFQKIFPQDSIPEAPYHQILHNTTIGGFFRGGFYTWSNKQDNKLYIPDAFSDLGIKIDSGNGKNFDAFADLRFRYGAQFSVPVSRFDFREGYIRLYGTKWNLTAGQEIIKWGRADFTNPTSKLSPQDFIYRSPDREDMNLGNLLSDFKWFPSRHFNLEAVFVPYYRASTLIIDPVPLPSNVVINKINSLLTGSNYHSYALKTNFHIEGFDWSFSWFDGYDPMPGIALSRFTLDLTQPVPVPSAELSEKPYRTRVAGADFETNAGNVGLRGEAAWSFPFSPGGTDEYVPLPEIKWVAGVDWFSGNWHFTGEYTGKYITRFSPSAVQPLIGTEPDYAALAAMLSTPGFDLNEYVRQQVASFNRLYNYQLERYYHTVSLRIETDMAYGKIIPSLFSSWNIKSHDLLLIPELKYKPADGLTLTAGAEIYSGSKGSLFDLINDFMNGVYVSLRVDF
jgi:hypothetical protein